MKQDIALISVGMNTPLKIQEERIWSNWFRGMLGDRAYLINNISMLDNGIEYKKGELIDHSQQFKNPGHLPGCTAGLMLGLAHLKSIDFDGLVILTVCDVIADEGFKDILNVSDFDADIYSHDWGPECIATDWIMLSPKIWRDFKFPEFKGVDRKTNYPVLKDHDGNLFYAPAGTPTLEKWNKKYIESQDWNHKHFVGSESPGWGTNVGVWMEVSGKKFRVVQSGGDARPTKTHLTTKYMEFDRDFCE